MLLIYGSTGYTGRLIAQEALARGVHPVLAARNGDAVREQAAALGLEHRVASLDDGAGLDAALAGATVVVHCAGPFSHTWRAMSDACLRNGVHYMDITGEIAVFEGLATRDRGAREAGIMLLPGVGFDVVPSDCLAAHLARQLPAADHLALAFTSLGGMSRGTMRTAIQNLGSPGAVRRNGKIVRVPSGWKTRRIDFGGGRVSNATTIPWGDVSTAWHSTGIPNIEVYMSSGPAMRWTLVASRWLGPVLCTRLVRGALDAWVRRGPAGPDERRRTHGESRLWGEATASDGRRVEALLSAPSGYSLTAKTAVHLALKALGGKAPAGFQTPSRAYGADMILEIPGVERTDVVA